MKPTLTREYSFGNDRLVVEVEIRDTLGRFRLTLYPRSGGAPISSGVKADGPVVILDHATDAIYMMHDKPFDDKLGLLEAYVPYRMFACNMTKSRSHE